MSSAIPTRPGATRPPILPRAHYTFFLLTQLPRLHLIPATVQQVESDQEHQASSPSRWKTIRDHPAHAIHLFVLLWLLVGLIIGWTVFSIKTTTENDGIWSLATGLFAMGLLTLIFLIFRHSVKLYTLLHPAPSSNLNLGTGATPTWLSNTSLPSYRDVLKDQGRTTTAGEDGWRGELPKYGNDTGSRVLLRSESRSSRSGEQSERTAA